MTAKENSLAFVEAVTFPEDSCSTITLMAADYRRILRLAKTAALIEVHTLNLTHLGMGRYASQTDDGEYAHADDLHTAVHAVADKIEEAK